MEIRRQGQEPAAAEQAQRDEGEADREGKDRHGEADHFLREGESDEDDTHKEVNAKKKLIRAR